MVRNYSLGRYAARPDWYDRSAIERSIVYSGDDVGPHATTTRASYTVPTGKKAFIGGIYLQVLRKTAATTLGRVALTAGGLGLAAVIVHHLNNTVGVIERTSVYEGSALDAGTTVLITTVDLSTGGTMDYRASISIVEFDA